MRLPRPTRPVALVALLLGAIALLVACDGDDDAPDGDDEAAADHDGEATGGVADAGDGLECEVAGYPCLWNEVSGDTVTESARLGEELAAYADAWDPDALAEVLGERDDVVDATIGPVSLRFRLDGGRPVWVLADAAYFPADDASAEAGGSVAAGGMGPEVDGSVRAGGGAVTASLASTASVGHASAETRAAAGAGTDADRRLAAVVGDDPAAKSALVIAPYEWEHATMGARHVADILKEARGYEGGVTYLANAAEDDRDVGPEAFQGWEAYDVVHVSTHGSQLCDNGGCRTALAFNGDSREIGAHEIDDSLMRAMGYADVPGVGLTFARDKIQPFIEGEWLLETYRGALDDTIVFVNACSSARAGDLSEAFSGDGSLFLGWSNIAMSDHASEAADRFYTEMSERGVVSEEAFAELVDDGLAESVLPEGYEREGEYQPGDVIYEWVDGELERVDPPAEVLEIDAELEHHPAGTDLRIREVIELQDPATGEMLRGGEEISLADGPDGPELPVRFLVDGVLEGEEAEFVVDLRVNGVGMPETWSVADDGELTDDETYVITDSVVLTDDMAEAERLDLEATTTLPEGGESEHHVSIAPIDLEISLEITMDFTELPGATIGSTVTATAPLGTGDDGELRGGGVLEWERVEYALPEGSCTVAAADFATELEIVGGAVDLDADEAEVAWRFDEGRDTLDLECQGITTSAFMDAFMAMAPVDQRWAGGSADMMAFGFSIAPAYVALGMGSGEGISYVVDGERMGPAEAEDAAGGAPPEAIVLTDWQPADGDAHLEFRREGNPPGMATSFTMQLRPRQE